MTSDEAVKIIKAGGWGYPENMVTEANMMAIDALEKLQAVQLFIAQLDQGMPLENTDPQFMGMKQVIDWLSPILWSEVEE